MTYSYTINCKIPTESTTPIVVYDSDYKSLDFYHPDSGRTSTVTTFDNFLQNAIIDSDGTFTKRELDHRDKKQLGFHVESDYSQTASYDPINQKLTRFYPSIYSADLKIAFHNQLKLSGYLTTTNKAYFHSISSNGDFQIEDVDFLLQFFNRQNKTLRKYDYKWLNSKLRYADGDIDYRNYDSKDMVEQCQTSHDGQFANRKEHNSQIDDEFFALEPEYLPGTLPDGTYGPKVPDRIFGNTYMGSGSSYEMSFNDFPNKAMKGKLRLEDHDGVVSYEECLIEDYYVSIAPVNSRFITLMDLVKEYGFFAQESNPLVQYSGNREDRSLVRINNRYYTKCDEGRCQLPMRITVPDYKTSGSSSPFPSYDPDSLAPFLGFNKSIVGDKSNLLVTIPSGYRKRALSGLYTTRPSAGSELLFDYLRLIIYQSKTEYDLSQLLSSNGQKSVKHFGFVSRYAYKHPKLWRVEDPISEPGTKVDKVDEGSLVASGNDKAVPGSVVFAHLYDLTASFYPKTIKTQTDIDTTKYKSIKIVTEKLKETDILRTSIKNKDSYTWEKTKTEDGVSSTLANRFHMYQTEGKKLYYTTYAFVKNYLYTLVHRDRQDWRGFHFHDTQLADRNTSKEINPAARDHINFKPSQSNENLEMNREIELLPITGSVAPISNSMTAALASLRDERIGDYLLNVDTQMPESDYFAITPSVRKISAEIDSSTSDIYFDWVPPGVSRVQNYKRVANSRVTDESVTTELKNYKYSIEKKSGPYQKWTIVKEGNQPYSSTNRITYSAAIDAQEWFESGYSDDSVDFGDSTRNASNVEYKFSITALYEDSHSGILKSNTEFYILDYDPYLFSDLPSLTPYKPNLVFKRSSVTSLTFEVTFDYNLSDKYDSLRRDINQIQVEYYEKSNGVILSSDKKTLLVDSIQNEWPESRRSISFKQSITIDSLSDNKEYVVTVKTKNMFAESNLSNQVSTKTKVSTKKSKIKLDILERDVTKLIITEVNTTAETATLTDVDIKYTHNSATYPINTGPLAVASLSPLDSFLGYAELILVGPPGRYNISATPVYGSLGNGTVVTQSVTIPSRSRSVNIVNNNTTGQLSSTLLPLYLYIKHHDSASSYGLNNSVGYYIGDNQATSTTAKELGVSYGYIHPQEEVQTVDRVQDISMSFKSENISYKMNTSSNSNWSSTATSYESFQPSFKFVIQKNGNDNTSNLICLLGPDPTVMFNAYSDDVRSDGSFQTDGTVNSGGVLTTPLEWRYNGGRPIPVQQRTPDLGWGSPTSSAGESSYDRKGRQKEYAIFYYKLPAGVNRFTNYYYYDKSTDTLYLQLASKSQKRYISIQHLINISSGGIIERNKPITIQPQPIGYSNTKQGINTFFYSSLALERHMNLVAKTINTIIKINGTATIPANLLNNDLTGSPSAYRYSSNDQPDNGFYAKTKTNTGLNFYNAKLSNNTLSNNMSGLRQTWQDVTNLPRDIIYEDSGFYLVSNQIYRAPSNSVDLATISPIILSSSIDNGVGAYKGFSTVTIKAKYEGEIDLNLFSFDGYIVEKYIDSNWVVINTHSASTEFFEDNSFEGSFSFRIVLADGVTQYRTAIKVRNGQGSVIKGKYVIIDRLFENLIAEDFN